MNSLTWGKLRILGASKIMSLAALMPFLGFFIILNQHTVEFINWLGTALDASDQSPNAYPSFKLFALYYGAVLLGIGKILFNVSCPSEIAQYANREDYIERRERLKTELEYTSLLGLVLAHGDSYRSEAEKFSDADVRNSELDSTGEGFRTLLALHWDYLDQSNRPGRRLVAGFFISGLVMFSYPSLVTLLKVTQIFATHMLNI